MSSMDAQRREIAVLADESRFSVYEAIFRKKGFLDEDGVRPVHQRGFSTRIDWRKTLTRFERAGVGAAIIDDASFSDTDAMLAGLWKYAVSREGEGGNGDENGDGTGDRLRLIFVGSEDRRAADEVFPRLAALGVSDLVIPARDGDVASGLRNLLRQPAPGESAASPGAGASDSGASASPVSPAAPQEPSSRSGQVRYAARGKSVIAVAGIMPRSGATNCSIVLARHLVMLGQTPALIVDRRTAAGFRKGYRFAMAPDGKCFRVNGVDIFPEETASVVPRRYTHVVVDVGYLTWGLQAPTVEEQQKIVEFNKADLQVVYLPCSSPADFEYLNRFFESRTRAELERYAIGVWGATDELFDMIRTKFREKAPEVFMWNVDVYRWPLSLGEVTPDIVEVLRPVLPRGVAGAAAVAGMRARAASVRQAR